MLTHRIRFVHTTWLCMVLSVPVAGASGAFTNLLAPPDGGIWHVATPDELVRAMLWLADVNQTDVVYDLGSGDGRIPIAAVRDFGARKAVGIEIDPKLVAISRSNATTAGVARRVKFIHGDLFTNDFSEATVVTLYLSRQANLELRPKLVQLLKPGARVVSHQFGLGEWLPHKEFRVRVPFIGMYSEVLNPFSQCEHVPDYELEFDFPEVNGVWLWLVPAKVAGVWHGKVALGNTEHDLKLKLTQTLTRVAGEFELSGTTNIKGRLKCSLLGDKFRCNGYRGLSSAEAFAFDGHVKGDELDGSLTFHLPGFLGSPETEQIISAFAKDRSVQRKFRARREPANYLGLWEWTDPVTKRTVRLRLQMHNSTVIATYIDGEDTLPITDFYDFGGGFTLR